MTALALVLIVKIVLTILLWSIPLLFFPTSWLVFLGIPEPVNRVFLRLLGMAYSALVVGYIFGLLETLKGTRPIKTVWVGIVSNGGAFLILLIYGVLGTWQAWGVFAKVLMWLSLVATGCITLGLILTGVIAPEVKR